MDQDYQIELGHTSLWRVVTFSPVGTLTLLHGFTEPQLDIGTAVPAEDATDAVHHFGEGVPTCNDVCSRDDLLLLVSRRERDPMTGAPEPCTISKR